jgi:hypothetical protein
VVERSSECLSQVIWEMTVVWAFDTLGYAKRLREAGVPNPQAEGHAEAAREFIMTELVTKQDLLAIRQDLQAVKQELQAELGTLRTELRTEVGALQTAINAVEARLEAKIDTQTLRLTVRLGGIVVAGIGILALFLRLH